MASQTGILGLQGTVGGLVFAKDGLVCQKPASNKAAFTSSASLARTRENASEFGRAASAGDGLYALTTGCSAPANMDINVGGAQVASVAYLDRYNGKPFSFTHAGAAHTGAFAATVNV